MTTSFNVEMDGGKSVIRTEFSLFDTMKNDDRGLFDTMQNRNEDSSRAEMINDLFREDEVSNNDTLYGSQSSLKESGEINSNSDADSSKVKRTDNNSKKRKFEDKNRKRRKSRNMNDNKRKMDDNKRKTPIKKEYKNRRRNYDNDNEDAHLKFLIPKLAAGKVIGRGGERIGQIKKEAYVGIQMSKVDELFADTNERVCVITGRISDILKAYEMVHSQYENVDENRALQIKMLIHNNAAGPLIGKGGTNIKLIRDDSGCDVQVLGNGDGQDERLVVIEGPKEKRSIALRIIVEKVSEYAQLDISQTNYSTNSNSFDNQNNNCNNRDNLLDYNKLNDNGSNSLNLALSDGLNDLSELILNSGGSSRMTSDSLMESLRERGITGQASKDIIEAITVLIRHKQITEIPRENNNLLNNSTTGGGVAANISNGMGNQNSNNGFSNSNSDQNNINAATILQLLSCISNQNKC